MDTIFVSELRNRYGIEFIHLELLDEAFTHSSYANEHKELAIKDNERLEFLGDAVLELTVSEFLYKQFPDLPEGRLTRLRSAIVCTKSFSSFAKDAHFDQFIRLGNGEEQAGARKRLTLLEDCFEAFNGALYLDQGKAAVVKFISQVIFPRIIDGEFSDNVDHKSHLQEKVQETGDAEIEYVTLEQSGPAHQLTFEVAVMINGKEMGQGQGRSKKIAEQQAAKVALNRINDASKE